MVLVKGFIKYQKQNSEGWRLSQTKTRTETKFLQTLSKEKMSKFKILPSKVSSTKEEKVFFFFFSSAA